MQNRVIEIVTFKLAKDVKDEDFLGASKAITAFARKQDGFVSRRLSTSGDGIWMDHVEWETMEAAQAAQEAFPKDENLAPIMAMIDQEALVMSHHALMDIL